MAGGNIRSASLSPSVSLALESRPPKWKAFKPTKKINHLFSGCSLARLNWVYEPLPRGPAKVSLLLAGAFSGGSDSSPAAARPHKCRVDVWNSLIMLTAVGGELQGCFLFFFFRSFFVCLFRRTACYDTLCFKIVPSDFSAFGDRRKELHRACSRMAF